MTLIKKVLARAFSTYPLTFCIKLSSKAMAFSEFIRLPEEKVGRYSMSHQSTSSYPTRMVHEQIGSAISLLIPGRLCETPDRSHYPRAACSYWSLYHLEGWMFLFPIKVLYIEPVRRSP